jgi:SanA protein
MIKKILCILAGLSILGALFVAILTLVFHFETKAFIKSDSKQLPVTEAALIPGAAILKNGDLSPVLKDRVDKALDLYREHKVIKILVTGNNGQLDYDEVDPVRRYLLKEGVPSQSIFLDHAGFDTYSSMYRARDVFNVTSVIIVSQSFHLPRAVYIARALGINAFGYVADNGYYTYTNYVREIPADVKAFLDLTFSRKPKFLGPVIPITGTGEDTL